MLSRVIQAKRLRTLVIARLFIGASLLFYAQYVFPIERVVFYAIIALISILSVFYVAWLLAGKYLRPLAYVQICCDLVLESLLIYYTGGVDSLFAAIYVLSILSAGLILSPESSFYVAAGSMFCFVGAALLVYFRYRLLPIPFPNPAFGTNRESIYLFYASYFSITLFFLVAFLTYYFSQMIQQLESKVRIQERLVFLGEVTSSIAHEIRNPLTSISGSVELISKQLDSKLTDKQRRLMDAVVDESSRINRIFQGLLDYGRMPELHYEKVSIEPFLDQIFLLMHQQEGFNPHVEIRARYRGKRVKMSADP